MGKKKTYQFNSKTYSKKIVFDIQNSFPRKIFMELASNLIGNTETIMESKLNKISMELRGEKTRIDYLINNLQILSNQIFEGMSPDLDGLFRYEKSFLDQVFKPQIQLKVLHQILKLFNYESNNFKC